MSAQEPAHKKAPGRAGATEATGTEGTTERSSLSATTVEGQDLDCPRCGGIAERLPAGQDRPTVRESYEYCWALADGSQPGEPGPYGRGQLCNRERRIEAGLLTRLLECTPAGCEALTPEVAASDGQGGITLAFLRYAQQHPLVSTELVLLLVDRLTGIQVRPVGKPKDNDAAGLAYMTLWLQGRGAASTIATRHRAELQALLTDLFDSRNALPRTQWVEGHWEDFTGPEIFQICLDESGGRTVLAWPDLKREPGHG